jgi:DNA-binding transcriptional ArsR family regulator
MKFKYNKEASRILDYLFFPGVYYFIEEQKKSEDELAKEVVSEEYIEHIEKINSSLEPYKEEIIKYYISDIYLNYDFTKILIHGFPAYTYVSEHQYLRDLMTMNETKFRKILIKTLMSIDDDEEESIEINDNELTESNALNFINELKIDSSNKWNLLMMIQKPKDYLKGYVALLEKVQSVFYKYYEQYSEEANEYGYALAERLSEDTEKTFDEITYNSIRYDFNGNKICNLYISTIFPYSVRFMNGEECRIVWGMKTEESFNALHEIREDKLTGRVKIFKALGDKTRYETLKLLANGDPTIKEIASKLDVSSATISYHVNEFLTNGIITLKLKKRKKSGYKVNYVKLNEVMSELIKDLNFPQ